MNNQELKYSHTVHYRDVEGAEDLAKKWQELDRQARAAHDELWRKINNSPEFKACKLLANNVTQGQGTSELKLGQTNATVHITMKFQANQQAKPMQSYLTDKTINQLLSSKLLTDDEKRHMLADCLGGYFAKLVKGDEGEQVKDDSEGAA